MAHRKHGTPKLPILATIRFELHWKTSHPSGLLLSHERANDLGVLLYPPFPLLLILGLHPGLEDGNQITKLPESVSNVSGRCLDRLYKVNSVGHSRLPGPRLVRLTRNITAAARLRRIRGGGDAPETFFQIRVPLEKGLVLGRVSNIG